MFRNIFSFALGLSLVVTTGLMNVQAQDAPADLDALAPPTAPVETKQLDLSVFKVPEKATAQELIQFVNELEKKIPQPKNEAEMRQLVDAMSKTFIEVSDKILAQKDIKPEEKKQAIQFKVIALTGKAGANPDNKAAAEELETFVDSLLKEAKTPEEKIAAWQFKLQSIAGLGGNDPASLEKVEKIADEVLKDKADELQVLGLEIKAQSALTKGEKDPAAFDKLVEFLDNYMKNKDLSNRCLIKAREIKFLALTVASQKDPKKEAALDAYFDEILKSEIAGEARKGIYQLRMQPLMGSQQAPPTPEQEAKLLTIAERLMTEKEAELGMLGIAVKSRILNSIAQKDPAKVADVMKFVDDLLAKNPSKEQKTLLYNTKIQAYLTKSRDNEKAMAELTEFVNKAFTVDRLPVLGNCKIRLLMFAVSEDSKKINELLQLHDEFSKDEAFKNIANSIAPDICMLQIKSISEAKGKIDELKPVLDKIKKLMESDPEIGTVIAGSQAEIEMIGSNNNDPKLYLNTLKDFAKFCAASKNEGIKSEAAFFDGQVKLVELPGTQLSFDGVVEDGSKFSTASFAGKIYLVDIWALQDQSYFNTVETLKNLYAGYKSKGFELVSVNLDNDTKYLKQIVEMLGISWPLVSKKMTADAAGKLPDILEAAGSGMKILVGKDGKVILAARTLDEIQAKLLALLGEPEKQAAPEKKADEKAAPAAEPKK